MVSLVVLVARACGGRIAFQPRQRAVHRTRVVRSVDEAEDLSRSLSVIRTHAELTHHDDVRPFLHRIVSVHQ
jgi:hypothetical protein